LARPVSALTRWSRWASKRRAVLWPVFAAGILLAFGGFFWIRREQNQKEANRHLESAQQPLGRASQAQYKRGASIQELSQSLSLARGFVEKAVQLAPELPRAHHLRGEIQILQGHYEEAEQSWRKALALDPRFGPAHF